MDRVQVIFTLFLLSATCLWSSGSCQDMDSLASTYLRQEDMRAAMDNLQKHDREAVQNALSAIENLWTVYLTEVLEDTNSTGSNFTEQCRNSFIDIFEYNMTKYPNYSIPIPGPRLIPIIDATGKQGAGIMDGNLIMDGAYDECFSYNYTGYCLASAVSLAPFLAPKKIPFPLVWTIGLCVPKGCNGSDISLLINKTMVLQSSEATVKCTDTKIPSYNAGAIIMQLVTGIFVLLVIVGTVVDIVLTHASKIWDRGIVPISSINGDSASINNTETDREYSETAPLLAMNRERCEYRVKPWEFITAFSLFKTVPTLLATKQSSTVITSLNGLRVISMFWVILGHTHFWLFQGGVVHVDNLFKIRDLMGRFTFEAVASAFFAVDSFFFLSGVLVAYLTLREMKKRKGRFPFVHFYLHRYLRLTPTYAYVLFFTWFLSSHLSFGPGITLNDPFTEPCNKYWYTNFLYINNLFPWELKNECIGWSWYLANDMQFYVISPLILIAAYHLLPVGLVIAGLFMGSGFIITAALTGAYDFQANTFSLIAYSYVSKPNATLSYTDAIYIKPWDRIAPYIVGLALGYILYRGFRFRFGRIINSLLYGMLWYIATFVGFWIVYGLYFTWHGHIPHTAENVIYITFTRFLWAICLALMVFACHNGYGWFINSFLSMKIWTPLARMTFNAYLVHPVVLTVVYGQLQTPIHYTDISMACYAIAFVVLSYGVAAIVCVLVELPLGTVEMLIFKIFGSKGHDSLRHNVKADFDDIKEPLESDEA